MSRLSYEYKISSSANSYLESTKPHKDKHSQGHYKQSYHVNDELQEITTPVLPRPTTSFILQHQSYGQYITPPTLNMKLFALIAAFSAIATAIPAAMDESALFARGNSIVCTSAGNVPTYHDCNNCCAKKGCHEICGLVRVSGHGCEPGWSENVCI